MRSVNLSTLKAQLSAHIQLVRGGEEIIVRDRDRPVARLVPCESDEYTDQQQRLIAKGVLIPPKKKRLAGELLPVPVGRQISRELMDQIWREERDGK